MKYLLIVGLLFMSQTTQAGDYESLVVINRVWVDRFGVYVGFKTQPTDCVDLTGFYGAHAILNPSSPLFKEQLTILVAAKATGKKVDLWYVDRGDCKTSMDILDITAVGLSQEN